MSLTTQPDDALHRQVFLADVRRGVAAHLQLLPGIHLCTLQAGTRPGLALHIAREALQAGQVQRALERRFEQAVRYDGCFVYLDAQGTLVIWRSLPTHHNALDSAVSRLLSLANLDALDAPATR
ncbi:transcriptional regulator [Pseudomonas edaphica]|uniref:Transcriptional regulator n=1 Tax=Pseudomonas edaphica TaxID=2006980 RepID=A0A7Y7V7H0_9PSED|nr:transcriptional regulator [Pseudomonas edaphica]NVZ57180.1 transcriptional regulator [Pseudomonas edaphica]